MGGRRMSILNRLAAQISAGSIWVVDLTHMLDPDFPVIVLPPDFGQCARFRMEEISAYDHRGPAWKWHNISMSEISMSEHSGTHFDAPSHWISGRDLPRAAVDEIPVEMFTGPVAINDCSGGAAGSDDYELTPEIIQPWEAETAPSPRIAGF